MNEPNERSVNQIIGLFPTPFMRVESLLDKELINGLIRQFAPSAQTANANSQQLSHTEILAPDSHHLLWACSMQIAPKLADFGELMFGERLDWSIKEMWVNILETGGRQAMHNHANCFISGVIYLSDSHPSANTVFMKGPGGRDFVFGNAHKNVELGPFNADKWIAPDPSPGDMVLFPSYLLHEVPVNQGQRRISLAFNAIPQRLDSWGYAVAFSK
ncbi:hypothetical protein BH11PSE11_BH11PSE11_24070 [soil metagenome]